jgi:hypothetical protein
VIPDARSLTSGFLTLWIGVRPATAAWREGACPREGGGTARAGGPEPAEVKLVWRRRRMRRRVQGLERGLEAVCFRLLASGIWHLASDLGSARDGFR